MPLQTPDFDALRERYLQQVLNQDPQASTGADSDHFVRASGMAAAVESVHQHLWWLSRQLFPSTADREYLEQLAAERGMARKAAVVASGTLTLTGTPGTPVSAGLQWQAPSGALYELTENTVIGGGGTVSAAAWALVAGPEGNLAAATALTASTTVAGINGATVVTMAGGAAAETDDALRERLLLLMRGAPAGGNAADYKRWALEVSGVSRAWVFGNRRTLGTVDVVVMAPGGVPAGGVLAAVTDHINARRPVTADVLVLAPSLVSVAVAATVTLGGTTLASAQAQAAAAIAAYVDGLAPGETVFRSRLIAAVQDVPGVASVALTAPAADVTTTVNSVLVQLASLGTVVLSV